MFKLIKEGEFILNQREIIHSLWRSIWNYFGLKFASKIGLWLLDINFIEGYGIIRCSHYTKEIVISALTLTTEISGKKVILSPIRTSGTIRSIKKIKTHIFDKK